MDKKKTPGKNGYKYKPRFGVMIICSDEHQQRSVYEAVKHQGHKVKVVSI